MPVRKAKNISEGLEKTGVLLRYFSTFAFSIGIALYESWELTLVICAAAPVLASINFLFARINSKLSTRLDEEKAKIDSLVNEVVGSIRTIRSLPESFKFEQDRFKSRLRRTRSLTFRKSFLEGVNRGLSAIVIFSTYALGLWFGSTLVQVQKLSGGSVITTFFCVLLGVANLANAQPAIYSVVLARRAAFEIFQIISRKSQINSLTDKGKKFKFSGKIEFKCVSFRYPSRPSVLVLNKLSFVVEPGMKVAFVGPSGSGKSTITALLLRFYDPEEGNILIDGHDIRTINVHWLRHQIGTVLQEPVLFSGTIAWNISLGRRLKPVESGVKEAARISNALKFITEFESGFQTVVGEKGFLISGGQKQRIAIARAVFGQPSIFLFDEATSALDSKSKKKLFRNIERSFPATTSLIITHRLEDIRRVDMIFFLVSGTIAIKGTFDEVCDRKEFLSEFGEMLSSHQSDAIHVISPEMIFFNNLESVELSSKSNRKPILQRDVPWFRLFKMNMRQMPWIFFGLLGSLVFGVSQPVLSIMISEVMDLFLKTNITNYDAQIRWWCFGMFGLGVSTLVGSLVHSWSLSKNGQSFTAHLRKKIFFSILRHKIEWFDRQENQPSSLSELLSVETPLVEGLIGPRLSSLLHLVSSSLTGLAIGFISGPFLTLALFVYVPFVAIGTALDRVTDTKGLWKKSSFLVQSAQANLIEVVCNIRTVASLGCERDVLEQFRHKLRTPLKIAILLGHNSSFAQALGDGMMFVVQGLVMWLGGWMVTKGGGSEINNDSQVYRLTYKDFFRVLTAAVLTGLSISSALQMRIEFKKTKIACERVFTIIDEEIESDIGPEYGPTFDPMNFLNRNCAIEFRNVCFAYPTRIAQLVLQDVSFRILSGQTVAFVGGSGCGKSTLIQLILRFYLPQRGKIYLGGRKLEKIYRSWLCNLIGYVGQEPGLFGGTIAENIRRGCPSASIEQVKEAARLADVTSFVSNLPEGLDTEIGPLGGFLSGGQRQRIALARAIINDPPLLVLDEATSALDFSSEKVVQKALKSVSYGRTTVIASHRLNCVIEADWIFVFKDGNIVEEGTHQDLLNLGGHYIQIFESQLANQGLIE
jgi:ABC-type multidrug transport system fused ATPase/permease subunit